MRCSNAVATRKSWRAILIGMAGLLLGAASGSTIAQDYPSKPIRIVVGFSPDSHVRAEVAKFQKIVHDAGIKPE
jgi:hypothetical protein